MTFLLRIILRPESLALYLSFLKSLLLTSKAEQVDGEALLCMNEETLKILVPPASVRAKLLHKIQKLNDKSTDVRIIHEVSTKVRPVYEAVNAETVGEPSSAQQLIKTYEDLFTSKGPVTNIILFYMKTATGVEGEGFANFVHVVVYCM